MYWWRGEFYKLSVNCMKPWRRGEKKCFLVFMTLWRLMPNLLMNYFSVLNLEAFGVSKPEFGAGSACASLHFNMEFSWYNCLIEIGGWWFGCNFWRRNAWDLKFGQKLQNEIYQLLALKWNWYHVCSSCWKCKMEWSGARGCWRDAIFGEDEADMKWKICGWSWRNSWIQMAVWTQ